MCFRKKKKKEDFRLFSKCRLILAITTYLSVLIHSLCHISMDSKASNVKKIVMQFQTVLSVEECNVTCNLII